MWMQRTQLKMRILLAKRRKTTSNSCRSQSSRLQDVRPSTTKRMNSKTRMCKWKIWFSWKMSWNSFSFSFVRALRVCCCWRASTCMRMWTCQLKIFSLRRKPLRLLSYCKISKIWRKRSRIKPTRMRRIKCKTKRTKFWKIRKKMLKNSLQN